MFMFGGDILIMARDEARNILESDFKGYGI